MTPDQAWDYVTNNCEWFVKDHVEYHIYIIYGIQYFYSFSFPTQIIHVTIHSPHHVKYTFISIINKPINISPCFFLFRINMARTIPRVIALLFMALTFVFLAVTTMSTHWREDEDDRFGVHITLGLWRICRDIKFGATLDHKCDVTLSNNAPSKYTVLFYFGPTLRQPTS